MVALCVLGNIALVKRPNQEHAMTVTYNQQSIICKKRWHRTKKNKEAVILPIKFTLIKKTVITESAILEHTELKNLVLFVCAYININIQIYINTDI